MQNETGEGPSLWPLEEQVAAGQAMKQLHIWSREELEEAKALKGQ